MKLTLKKTKATLPTIVVHNKAKGNLSADREKLEQAGLIGASFNKDKVDYNIQWISTDLLVPLETQRDTESSWAVNRLIEKNGFDWAAAGVLLVQKAKEFPEYFVFDGCGRFLMAEMVDIEELPCLVYNISKAQASEYFAYMQSNGRRNLTKEIIFANRVAAQDPKAIDHEQWLQNLGLHIVAATKPTLLQIGDSTGSQVKYRFVEMAYGKYTHEQLKMVKTWIQSAWPKETSIHQDMYMGLLHLVSVVPGAMKNGLNNAITNYFNTLNIQYRESKKTEWKHKGGNQHNAEKESVAIGFLEDFRNSAFWKHNFTSQGMTRINLGDKK
jgi:hypothetical protein